MNPCSKSSSIACVPDLISDFESATIYDADDYDQDTIKLKKISDSMITDIAPLSNPFVEVLESIEYLPAPLPTTNNIRDEKVKKEKSSISSDRYSLLHDICGVDVKGVIFDDFSSYNKHRTPNAGDKLPFLNRPSDFPSSLVQSENKLKSSMSFLGKVSGFFKKKPITKSEEEDGRLFSSFSLSTGNRALSSNLSKNTNSYNNSIKSSNTSTHTIKNTIEPSSSLDEHLSSPNYLKKKALWGHFLIIKSSMISSPRYHLFYELYNCELTNFKCCIDLKVFIEDAKKEFFSQTHSFSKESLACAKSLVPKTEFSIYDLQDLQLNYEDVLLVSSSILIELVSILVGFITNSDVEDIKDENQRQLLTLKLSSAFDKIEPVIIRYAFLLDRANITARRTLENCLLFREFSTIQLGPDAPKLLFEILSRPLITLSKYLTIINGLLKETHPTCPDYEHLRSFTAKLKDLLCSVNKNYSLS